MKLVSLFLITLGLAACSLLPHSLLAQAPTPVPAQAPAAKKPADVVAGIPVNYNEELVGTYTLPVPLLLSINFLPNPMLIDDPGVRPGRLWNKEKQQVPAPAYNPNSPFKLTVEPFLEQGIGVASVYYGDIEPDFDGGLKYGVRSLYLKPGQTQVAPDEWGAVAAWSWGLSRALDYFETDKAVDSKRVALLGASRLGKTVLWAGANDPRYALVIASVSGEGGAALARRNYGETIAHLVAPTRYPYQFCQNYQQLAGRTDAPMDAHMLVALVAPRPLLLQTGSTDYWSDPKGEFLSAVAATPVYNLLGRQGVPAGPMPPPSQLVGHTLSYYMHEGPHGIIPSDYTIFAEFIRAQLLPSK